jgi:hypothetical protein
MLRFLLPLPKREARTAALSYRRLLSITKLVAITQSHHQQEAATRHVATSKKGGRSLYFEQLRFR